jgi:GNAT superfamily N-acetyltransferase
MLTIAQVETDDHRRQVREIFWEYLSWGNPRIECEFGTRLNISEMLDQDMTDLQKFAPPRGCLLLASTEQQLAGCVGLRAIGVEIGEIKRMYVRPQLRGQGIARALVAAIVDEARHIGYTTLRLDSPPFSQAAHALYLAVGFRPITAYPECEIPEAFHEQWHFMELSLSGDVRS